MARLQSFGTIFALLCIALASVTAAVPPEWQSKINSFNAFYADDDTMPLGSNGYPTDMYLPTIGNGYLSHEKGVRSNTMLLSGLFNNATTSPSHRAKIPATLDVTVLNSATTGVLWDLETATYHRRGAIADSSSEYELRWYAHRDSSLRSVYALELEVFLSEEDKEVTLSLNSSDFILSGDFNDFNNGYTIVERGQRIACAFTTIAETTDSSIHEMCSMYTDIPKALTVKASDPIKVFTYLQVVRSSLDALTHTVNAAVQEDYNTAMKLVSSQSLYPLHVGAWSELHSTGVDVSGRPDLAKAVNASIHAILSSVREDWAYGLAPGGITNYYNGHSFWDTETWMYPPMLFLHPDIARSLVQYRFDRMDGARQKAQSYDPPFNGTMFPWESAFSGVETCPTFAATGLREDHISGDIAFAVWQYFSLTKDLAWLRDTGYPILEGISDFWVSRSVYSEDGTAHILNVIPPDEYVDHVDDSVYTNYVASLALKYTVQAARLLAVDCLRCSGYSDLSEDLVILYDSSLGINPEYLNYPGNTIKQADAVLLAYPLGMPMAADVRQRDLDYYSVRTDSHGPAMTWGMHSIGYLDLNQFDKAAKFLNMSFQDNTHEPLHVWTETPDGNACNFITGAGGFLQTVISGYLGIRLTDNDISFAPFCPEGATGLKFRGLSYLDGKFDYEIFCDGAADTPYLIEVTQVGDSAGRFSVQSPTEQQTLAAGKTVAFTATAAIQLSLQRVQ